MDVLKVDGLKVSYGGIKALRGISFTVGDGEIVTLVGSNGAGKSTTLRAIMGQVKTEGGKIMFGYENLGNFTTPDRVRSGLSLVPEARRIFPNLTVMENLILGGYIISDRMEIYKMIDEYLELFPRLKDRISQKGGTLSGGEQQMLAIARALMSKPKLIMMDEPSLGIAPKITEEIFNKIVELKNDGKSILLVEQNAGEALKIANRAYVLDTGSIVLSGTGEEVLNNDEIKKAYLGG